VAKGGNGGIDQSRQDDADTDDRQLVLERGPGVRTEERPRDYGQGVEKPEAEDRLGRKTVDC
jgi:hypothetical protein